MGTSGNPTLVSLEMASASLGFNIQLMTSDSYLHTPTSL